MEPLTAIQREVKIRAIKSIISACKLTPNRPDILALWNVTSFEDMLDSELVECKAFMEAAQRGKTTLPPEPIRRLRSRVLTLCNKIGKYASSNDWTEVNRFLLQRKVCGKLLYMLEREELQALVRKLRAIADKVPAPTPAGDPHPSDGSKEPKMFAVVKTSGQCIVN